MHLDVREPISQFQHHTAHARIGRQHVGAEAEHAQAHALSAAQRRDRAHLLFGCGLHQPLRGPADLEGGVRRERLFRLHRIGTDDTAQLLVKRCHEA